MYLFLYIIDWVVFLESIYIVIRGISYFIFKSRILLIVNRKRDFKFFYNFFLKYEFKKRLMGYIV